MRDARASGPPLLEGVEVDGNRIRYRLNARLRRVHVRHDLWIRFPEGVDLAALPESVRLVPVAYQLAPLIWAYDERFVLPVLDERVVTAFEEIRGFLRGLYPGIGWNGELVASASERVEARKPAGRNPYAAAALFTAGVDSTHTALSHADERLLLVNIWAARTGRSQLGTAYGAWLADAAAFAERVGHELAVVETNAPAIIDRVRVTSELGRRHPIEGWWAGVHFSMALSSVVAPLLHWAGIERLYVASGAAADMLVARGFRLDGAWTDADASPAYNVDKRLSLGPARVEHDGYRTTRQGKIDFLVRQPALSPPDGPPFWLRVCGKAFHETRGNCGDCEKCLRTMSMILVAGGDPCRLGFPSYGAQTLAAIERRFEQRRIGIADTRTVFWLAARERARALLAAAQREGAGTFGSFTPDETRYLRWLAGFDFAAYERMWLSRSKRPVRLAHRLRVAVPLLSLRRRVRMSVARRKAMHGS